MKIKALRVREVGRFETPVAVEGFSGGLDVLCGPNEMGKSTLFRALRLVLGVKHTSKSDAVAKMAPYSGGQPLIEADLEIGGEAWRVTKRFGKGARAQVIDLSKGVVVARNADADELLSQMLESDATAFGAHGLIWVGQTSSLLTPSPNSGEERGALMNAIEAEVGTMTGSGIADAVRSRVEEQLGQYLTPKGAIKKGGRFAQAMERRDELQGQLAAEKHALRDVERSQEELAVLQSRFAEVGDAAQIAVLEEKAKAAANALDEAERQRLRLVRAKETVQFCSNEQKAAQVALSDFRTKIERLAQLSSGIDDEEVRLPQILRAAEEAQLAYEKSRSDGERLRAETERLQILLKRSEIEQQLTAKSKVLEDAQRLDLEISEETERMRSDPVTSDRIDRLQRVEHQYQLLEGRIAAESPSVTIKYVEGARQRILVNGEELPDGSMLRAREPLILEIPGLGSIEVAPSDGEGREELLEQSEKLSGERDALLSQIGAAGGDEARLLFADRQKRDRRLNAAIAELRGLAPDGPAALKSDVADLENQLAKLSVLDAGEASSLPAETVAAKLREVSEDLERARLAYPECAATLKSAAAAAAEAQTVASARRERIEELERLLGPRGNREEQVGDLQIRAATAEQKLAEAVRTAAALEEVLLDADALFDLKEQTGKAEQRLEAARTESGQLREAISAASARIEMAGQSGLGRRVLELEGDFERALADVAEVEAEVASLKLLLDALDKAREAARDRLLAPLQKRVEPYLAQVFGNARAQFAQGFAIEGLQREDRSVEEVARLSEGTQEQLGLLVRLAYARLIADSGEALPVILDDPLVYSDGKRIEQMFNAFREAALHHQVIVLSCREMAFAGLGGRQLSLGSWSPDVDF